MTPQYQANDSHHTMTALHSVRILAPVKTRARHAFIENPAMVGLIAGIAILLTIIALTSPRLSPQAPSNEHPQVSR